MGDISDTFCWKLNVETTNAMRDCFVKDGCYHPCIDGTVYVMARTAKEACELIGPAVNEINRIGVGFCPSCGC